MCNTARQDCSQPAASSIAFASLRFFTCLLLVQGLIACGGSNAPPASPRTRVILIAIDGATWDIILPMMEAGRLPNFKRLVHEGATGNMLTITEPHEYQSAALWTTAATGKHPSQHGILANTTAGNHLPTSNMRRVRALWNILSDYERRVGMVGYFVTWPVENVNGFMVSDRAWGEGLKQIDTPPGLLDRLGADPFWVWDPTGEATVRELRRFIGFDFNIDNAKKSKDTPETWRNYLVFERLNWVYPRDESFARIGLRLLEQERPDFFAIYFHGIDWVSHGFWVYHQPDWKGYHPDVVAMVREDDVKHMGNIIRRYYVYQDELLGRFLDAADSQTLVLVASDHGFGPGRVEGNHWYLTGTHRVEGILAAWGHGARPGIRIGDATLFDIAPTILHLLDLPVASDMPGRVLLEMFDSSVSEKIDRVVTHETVMDPDVSRSPILSPVDEQMLGRLKKIGYVD